MESWHDEQWRVAAKKDAPDYVEISQIPSQNCGNCRFIDKKTCRLYHFQTEITAWCISWKDAKLYGWWGGGRFPYHGVPPDNHLKLKDADIENGIFSDGTPNESLPAGDNNPQRGSDIPGNDSR